MNSYSGDVAGSSSIIEGLGRLTELYFGGSRTEEWSLYFYCFFIVSITVALLVDGDASSELPVRSFFGEIYDFLASKI